MGGGGERVPESEGKVPGMLRHMQHQHIHILLSALHLSYTAAVEFDRRPGLKFLIQKVAQAERAANLYRQAGASWTLRMVTLFDLTLSQVKNGLGLVEVKEILEKDVKAKNTVMNAGEEEEDRGHNPQCHLGATQGQEVETQNQGQTSNTECHKGATESHTAEPNTECHMVQEVDQSKVERQKECQKGDAEMENQMSNMQCQTSNAECHKGQVECQVPEKRRIPRPTTLLPKDTTLYIQQLRASFTQLCDVYLDLVIDRDGHYSAVDRMDDKPIFFLTVQPDEFPTAHRQALDEWAKTLEESTAHLAKGRRSKDREEEKEEEEKDEDASTVSDDAQDPNPNEVKEVEEEEVKPFSFADLAREYSSDSEDSEVLEFADGNDSGVVSLAGGWRKEQKEKQ